MSEQEGGESLPEDWAIDKALSMARTGTTRDDVKRHWPGHSMAIAFARYIAQHEEAPVDPLQECLRETYGAAAPEFVSAFRAALYKRGLKLARQGEPS